MKQINIHQAQTNLSKILEKVALGEKVIIANRGVPKAIISKYDRQEKYEKDSPFGRYKGQIEISKDFDEENPEINHLFGL